MSIKVRRNTGVMGGMMSVSLLIDSKKAAKLSENEEFIVDSTNIPTKIKAKQWYFGSPEMEVEDDSNVEITINPIAMLLLFLSMALIFAGSLLLPVLTVLGIVSCFATIFYATKNWFVIKVKKA
ncbi:hypothetical protein [Ornithinibacillus xuwenensis]|jgi:hypothetical protein|uniref:Uncharacterized protein n=1 Tax=Ornithinibacillus xuwenensis TaxID=3144668 RepID=A0ABU9XL02_9BACI